MRKKVLLLSNVPSPYLAPVYQSLKAETDWDLQVCYVSLWNAGVGWSKAAAKEYVKAGDFVLAKHGSMLAGCLGAQLVAAISLLAQLVKIRPGYLLIYGYTQLTQFTLLLWAVFFNVPFAIAGDANVYTDSAVGWRRTLKRWWLCNLVKRAAALVVVGIAGRMFWERYGAQPHQLFQAGFAVDNDYFRRASLKARVSALRLREENGWADSTVFLFVGRLIKRKNVAPLVAAVKQVGDLPIALLIAGDGPERNALELLAQGDERIRFAGMLTQQELPFYYAMSDVLVLPAEAEPWGLVINEAMACGLAVIAHRYCGATLDLVAEDNGFVLHSYAEKEMRQAIRLLANDRARVKRMQQHSLAKIEKWSTTAAAISLRNAVEATWHFPERLRRANPTISPDRSDAQ
jgi:glycosyltransferase involved in cell wall biosynthesis